MGVKSLLLANSFFLLVVLIIFLAILFRNGNPKLKNKKVKEDLKKIKDQINTNS